jgi:TPR repeat protein
MAGPTQFRQYLIAQDAEGNNVEVVRTAEQVGVLAFDTRRLSFVHCHVLLEPLSSRRSFDERARRFKASGHPRLARLIESGEDEGSAFYITANVDGESLRGYLSRFEQIPVWLAMRLTALSLEAVRALLDVGDFLPLQLMDVLRVVQTGPCEFQVMVADYRLSDPAGAKSAKARLAKSSFDKQEQFLGIFFLERLQTGASMQEATLSATDFSELLGNLLSSCGQGVDEGIAGVLKSLAKSTPAPPPGELAAQFKPRPLLAPLLMGFSEVARSVASHVRIQSQKLDPAQPYAMRGTLTKTGQNVLVEQVPPARMCGNGATLALRQVLQLPRIGKFPNLVPVNFVEEHEDLLCMAETAVEGIALSELLAARGTLDPHEAYLVMAGMDAALAQLEKTTLETRRLRLEDIFLFTGFSRGPASETGLLSQRLNEWPGFSVVLRAHPCLASMSGRGTDPAILLPADAKARGDAESVFNGAWMAALGCFLSGMPSGDATRHASGVEEVDATFRMFEEELIRGRKGAPSNRSTFLASFARIMQHHDIAQPEKGGGFWAELSGAGAAQGRAAEIARAIAAPPQEKGVVIVSKIAASVPKPMPAAEKPVIGFAEALIQQRQLAHETEYPEHGLKSIRSGLHGEPDPMESSWRPMHQAMPLWMRGLIFAGGSLVLGAALAHLSGRAIWQAPRTTSILKSGTATPGMVAPPSAAKLPGVPSSPKAPSTAPTAQAPQASGPKLAPPPPIALSAVDLEPRAGTRNAALVTSSSGTAATDSSEPELIAKLVELRKTGARLPADQRAAVEKLARSGNTEAMLALGRMHLRGETGAMDERAAFTWFDKAMNAGDPNATVPLADCYLQGLGTARDLPLGIDLLKKAVSGGDASAKELLGGCYAKGFGVDRDDAQAFALCSEAYSAGSVAACTTLGTLYLRGQGVTRDEAKAVQLFSEGARRGHANSMWSLAQSLEYGTGTPADRSLATQWYQQSARLGNVAAAMWCREKGVAY